MLAVSLIRDSKQLIITFIVAIDSTQRSIYQSLWSADITTTQLTENQLIVLNS